VVCEFRGKWKVSGGAEHEVEGGGTRKKGKGKTELQIS
jgi:hypothetical protein